jgi:hypothetical protein
MTKNQPRAQEPQATRPQWRRRTLLTALIATCALTGSLAPALSANAAERHPQAGGKRVDPPSKTFYVHDDTVTLTATVAQWTKPLYDNWIVHPAVGAKLTPRAFHTWDLSYRFTRPNESVVQYTLADAKTGAVRGTFDIDMATNAFNQGRAGCTVSVPNVSCATSVDDRGSVHIFLLQER